MPRLRRVFPSKRICEEFNLTYELRGAQRAVDLLARYYGIRRMKIEKKEKLTGTLAKLSNWH